MRSCNGLPPSRPPASAGRTSPTITRTPTRRILPLSHSIAAHLVPFASTSSSFSSRWWLSPSSPSPWSSAPSPAAEKFEVSRSGGARSWGSEVFTAESTSSSTAGLGGSTRLSAASSPAGSTPLSQGAHKASGLPHRTARTSSLLGGERGRLRRTASTMVARALSGMLSPAGSRMDQTSAIPAQPLRTRVPENRSRAPAGSLGVRRRTAWTRSPAEQFELQLRSPGPHAATEDAQSPAPQECPDRSTLESG